MQTIETIENLRIVASQKILNMNEASLLIENYIFQAKGIKITINDISNVELFERAITIACNYYDESEK
jgi:hypothetical protein